MIRQNPLLTLLLGANNPAAADIMMMAQGAGLVDIAVQGYQAYASGHIHDFVAYQYAHNDAFRKFYDSHKDQTLHDFFDSYGITIDDSASGVVK